MPPRTLSAVGARVGVVDLDPYRSAEVAFLRPPSQRWIRTMLRLKSARRTSWPVPSWPQGRRPGGPRPTRPRLYAMWERHRRCRHRAKRTHRTSKPTSLDVPTFVTDGVIPLLRAGHAGDGAQIGNRALENAALPWVVELARALADGVAPSSTMEQARVSGGSRIGALTEWTVAT